MNKQQIDPAFRAGAREERREHLARLRRRMRLFPTFGKDDTIRRAVYQAEIDWIVTRTKRVDARDGGLGKQ